MRTLLLTCVAWAVTASASQAFDLSKVERKLAKEPAYKHRPKYALLVFGPEAKVRVWVVMDGPTLYLDRNGDGDLTAADERFETETDCKDVVVTDPDGKTKYVITAVQSDYTVYAPDALKKRMAEGEPLQLDVKVDVKGPVEYRQYCDARMCDTPRKAPVAHFHGPLTIGPRTVDWKVPTDLVLRAGDNPAILQAAVGTMDSEHGCWVVVRSATGEQHDLPRDLHPVVDVVFPPKQKGGPPVERRYRLNERCCGALFKAPLPVPDEAGPGVAKVTYSFDAWRDGKVSPTTIEIPVVNGPAAANGKQ